MQFLAPTPLLRITELAQNFKGAVAVPFIGNGAAALLPLKAGSALVTRIDEASVRSRVARWTSASAMATTSACQTYAT